MKNRQIAPKLIFKQVYRIKSVRCEMLVLWHGRFTELVLNSRDGASRTSTKIDNLSPDRAFSVYIARKLCGLKISAVHLYDIIEDNIDCFADDFAKMSRIQKKQKFFRMNCIYFP